MSEERRIPEHVARLLSSSIETTERLEVLLHLRAAPEKSFSARSVAAACSVTPASAEQHLAILCGRGFLKVSISSDLLYAYQPVSPSIHAVLDELERVYRERPREVVAVLRDARDRDPVHAFANAFLVTKKAEKDG